MDTMISNIERVYEVCNRPPTIIDQVLLNLGIPISNKPGEYIGRLYDNRRDIIEELHRLEQSPKLKEVTDLLFKETVLYAVRRQPVYKKKYEKVGFDEKTILKEINSVEDVSKLPVLTNNEMRSEEIYPYGLYVPGKHIFKDKQSGGTTGPPTHIGYTLIDWYSNGLIVANGLKNLVGLKEGSRYLIFAPAESHIFGDIQERASLYLDIHCPWRHFAQRSTEELLKQIDYNRPNELVTVPIGKKGSTGSMDVLLEVDLKSGKNILENYFSGKTAVFGGAPSPVELIQNLHDLNIKAKNGYGTCHTSGYFECEKSMMVTGKRNDKINYFSETHLAPGYWVVSEVSAETMGKDWTRLVMSIIGREGMPLINLDTGDLTRITSCECGLQTKKIVDTCRSDWFHEEKDGSISIKIPDSHGGFCVSEI